MRRRISYANVAATLALVFSMSGGALAASHYLINSTKQINPKVLKKLKGSPGASGAPGAAGAPGASGKEGTRGKEGTAGKEGAPGQEGTPGPSGIGPVVSAFHEPPVELTSASEIQPVVSLSAIPPGSYWITATFAAFNTNVSVGRNRVDMKCVLSAGGDSDTRHFQLNFDNAGEDENVPVALQVVHMFTGGPGTATLECDDFEVAGIRIENIKISAIRVSGITNTGV